MGEKASAGWGLEDIVNQAALKPIGQWGADCAQPSQSSPDVVVPFVQAGGGITGEIVRRVCELRRARDAALPGNLFGEATWDVLLQLYAAHVDSQRISITRLTRQCGVPATTVLRRLARLEDRGLLIRTNDPFDARRVYVALSSTGAEAMERCFIASGLRTALL